MRATTSGPADRANVGKGKLNMAKHVQLHVRLGETEWVKHTYAREGTNSGLTLLGSIQKGMQRGALAQKSDGDYVMLVGDYEMPLNQHQVRAALQSGRASAPRVTWTAPKPSTTVPVVVVKKRRVIAAGV
jgi:hypothetical protein